MAFLSIATHYCKHAFTSTIGTREDDLFAFEDQQQDLFSSQNIFDDSFSTDATISEEENLWASSLQPINNADVYLSLTAEDNNNNNADFLPSSAGSDDFFLSSADACLTEDPFSFSGSLLGRSDIVATPSDFCFQNPPSEEKIPPLTLPNLLDLLQPDDQNDLLSPFDTFPRRPVCPGRNPMHVLCCEPEREDQTGDAADCEKCM